MRKEEKDFTKYVMVMMSRSAYRYPLLYRKSTYLFRVLFKYSKVDTFLRYSD